MTWLLLVGILADPDDCVKGKLQLYSLEMNVSQPMEGQVAAFAQIKLEGNSKESNLLSFAARDTDKGPSGKVSSSYLSPHYVRTLLSILHMI